MGVIGLWAVKMPRRPSSPVLPPSRRSCLRAAGCHSSWSRRTSESHPAKQDRLCRPVTCRFGSWRGDSNPQPAVYKTGANRPRRTPECCPGSSGRGGRPASALLTGRVAPGGMTSGMTSWPSRPRGSASVSAGCGAWLSDGRTSVAPSLEAFLCASAAGKFAKVQLSPPHVEVDD
jgi:hypothetical protein